MQGLALPRSPAVGRVGITHHPLASPSHPRRAVVTRAEPNNNKSSTRVSEIHQELLKEIEERRKSQAVLLEKLNKLAAETPQGDAGPAAPAVEAYAPPPPPPPPPVAQAPVFVAPAPAPPPPRSYTGAPVFMPPAPTFDLQMPMTIPLRPEIYIEPAPPVPEPVGFLDSAATDADAPPDEDLPPPLAGPNVMNIVMVGAECAPWSKTGGLGDVMSALPKALARRGHRVMCVAPRYANYDDAWETGIRKLYSVFGATHEVGYFHSYRDGVDYIFVDHPSYHGRQADIYGGDRLDLVFRCALLCKAALEAVWHVPCGGITYGDQNLCFIANDWHTALLPVYLQAHYRDYGKMNYARCAFVIHNMAHQGRGPFIETDNMELSTQYKEQMRLYDPIGGEHMNIMKAGLECAHRLVAVSHGYAWECQTVDGGWGLHEVLKVNNWKLRGIVNGIDYDEWDPATDKLLQSDGYKNYTTENFAEGKRACKVALQKELGLPVDPDAPMLGFIGRLDYQKGVDLIRDNYDWLMSERVQLVMLGSGRADLEDALRDMENRNKAQCRCWVGFSAKMAHRITAGADILLMPSRFEPCGLNQLYAMKYGTVPIVHAVGGLRDTVQQFNPFENKGTGWTFDRAEPPKLREAVGNALYTYRQFRNSFNDIGKRGMEQDLSWDNAAAIYEEVLVAAKFQW